MANVKYTEGYIPKIQYWTSKLNDELSNTKVPSIRIIDSIHRKLDFFIQKEWDRTVTSK